MSHTSFPESGTGSPVMANVENTIVAGPEPGGQPGTPDFPYQEQVLELVRNGSIELSISNVAQIIEGAPFLPFGMGVYVPSTPNRDLMSNIEFIRAIHESGLNPIPHIAARKIQSRKELEDFLKRVVAECGVHRALVIGGDASKALGPYSASADILQEGILSDLGIREVAVAGYPEGHRKIPNELLMADLELKVETARSQDMGIEIITQFCFTPSKITDYCTLLSHRLPGVPVYAGLAGPTSAVKLARYARHCGVNTSLLALGAMGAGAVKFLTHTDPTEQAHALAHYLAVREDNNLIGLHLFSFGGFVDTARWIRNKCHGK